jgi:hypothetical protein
MSTVRGSAQSKSYAALLPVALSDEFVRLTDPINDRFVNRQPTLRKRALRVLAHFLVTFCIFLAAILAWRSYGDAARRVIANSYRQLGWLAPRGALTAQKAPDTIAWAASAAPYPDRQQFGAMLRDIQSMRQSIDQIAAGQEQTVRSIDQIATTIAATQEQMTRTTDQTAISIAQAPSADAIRITVESRADGASLQPTVPLDIAPTEARPPQTLSERGKQFSAASGGHDASCFPSASAVQNHPGETPTWTLRAPGHEGTLCWYAAARPRGSDHRPRTSDHRRETTPGKEIRTTKNGLSAPSAPRGRAEGRDVGLPY